MHRTFKTTSKCSELRILQYSGIQHTKVFRECTNQSYYISHSKNVPSTKNKMVLSKCIRYTVYYTMFTYSDVKCSNAPSTILYYLLLTIRLLPFVYWIFFLRKSIEFSFGHDFIQNVSRTSKESTQMNNVHVSYSFWIHNAFSCTIWRRRKTDENKWRKRNLKSKCPNVQA